MHPNFADWYQPVTFNHVGETLNLRWKGIEGFLNAPKFPTILDLVRHVYVPATSSNASLEEIRKHFKAADPTFKTVGNDLEVQVLIGCILAVICLDENFEFGESSAQAILTASACRVRKPKVEIDLIGMADRRVKAAGIKARSRAEMQSPEHFTHKKAFEDGANFLNTTPSWPNAVEAMKKIGAAAESLASSIQKEFGEKITQMQDLLTIQDEELQILWWLVGGWSEMWGRNFDEIRSQARPILLAIEASKLTSGLSEFPSLKAIFMRLGIGGNSKVSIPLIVNSCGPENLKLIAPGKSPCPVLFPLNSAIYRASETGASDSWFEAWGNTSQIKIGSKTNALELAMQVFREQKLNMFNENLNV
ncbi:MAG: GTPase-associated system all-helical protein GASH [Candidatus Ozemobacteraceae bacterium]